MRVLVIEDDVVTAARIEIVLQGEDFICDLAHRGSASDVEVILVERVNDEFRIVVYMMHHDVGRILATRATSVS